MTNGVSPPMPTDPRASGASAHASHDPTLMAALAADDLAPADRSSAEATAAACAECGAIVADLRALTRAVRSDLPVPRRHRDFRLTEEDARRLRGGSPLRRLLEWFGSPGFAALQPLGGAAAALGLTIMLVTGGVLPFGAASAPVGGGGATSQEVMSAPSPGATAPAGMPAASATAGAQPPEDTEGGVTEASPGTAVHGGADDGFGEDGRSTGDSGATARTGDRDVVTGASPGLLVGAALIVAGLGVLGLRWAGGRLRRLG